MTRPIPKSNRIALGAAIVLTASVVLGLKPPEPSREQHDQQSMQDSEQQAAPPVVQLPSPPLHDGPPLPSAKSLQWPSETSAAPQSKEWHGAPVIGPTRMIGERANACKVRQVREWVSIRCDSTVVSAMTQLGGTQKGVSFHLDKPGADRLPREGVVVFPLRQGTRRVFSLWTLGPGYDGPLTVIPGVIVQAEWLADTPVLLLHDALNEPVRTAQSEKRRSAP